MLGYQRANVCHLDYLPVYLGKEAAYLDTMGLVFTESLLDQVDGKGIFTPTFLAADGRLIQANPQVTEVKMTISKPEGLGFHEQPLDHVEETDSLLYTKGEFEAYNEYLHASCAQKAIQTAMTRKYCFGTKQCELYQPTQPGTLNLGNLIDKSQKSWTGSSRYLIMYKTGDSNPP